ncbi:protein FAM161A [Ixodes scapularis]
MFVCRERRREEERRRDEEEQRERVRTLRKSRVELHMRALACRLSRPCSSDSIRDRLRAHRMAAMQRLEDYRQELQDIQDRVSSNPLLVERRALYGAQRLLEHQYERKLQELGLDHHFLESKAALHVQRRRSRSLDSRSVASGSSAGSPQRSKREAPAADLDACPRSASLRSSAASDEQSDTENARGSHPDLSQASGERESDRKSAVSASSSSIRTTAST